MGREDRRQLMHAAATLPALALAWLSPAAAVAFAVAGVLLGVVVLPRLGVDRMIIREGEARVSGVQLYPIGVLGVVLIFPLPIAAAGWAVLGIGDAASNVIGRRLGRGRLPWNRRRSWAGTAAFVVFAAPAAAALLAWVWPNGTASPLGVGWPFAVADARIESIAPAAIAGAVVGAAAESLGGVDDNVTIPIAASLAAWIMLIVA